VAIGYLLLIVWDGLLRFAHDDVLILFHV